MRYFEQMLKWELEVRKVKLISRCLMSEIERMLFTSWNKCGVLNQKTLYTRYFTSTQKGNFCILHMSKENVLKVEWKE